MKINPKTDALIVIDVQNDFVPGGALAVSGGDEIISGIVDLASKFETVVISQDWHPQNHKSFAVNHGKEAFTQVEMPYGNQTLWPTHCVQGTEGADFHKDLIAGGVVDKAAMIIRKGMNPEVDSYSAFYENDGETKTGLSGFLNDRGIKRVFCVGLAYDFCVGYTAKDAKAEGFDVVVVKDLCRAIGAPVGEGLTTVDLIEKDFDDLKLDLVFSSYLNNNLNNRVKP